MSSTDVVLAAMCGPPFRKQGTVAELSQALTATPPQKACVWRAGGKRVPDGVAEADSAEIGE